MPKKKPPKTSEKRLDYEERKKILLENGSYINDLYTRTQKLRTTPVYKKQKEGEVFEGKGNKYFKEPVCKKPKGSTQRLQKHQYFSGKKKIKISPEKVMAKKEVIV
tara:strand:- start:633 stop:950 length:318 start_codon:yes stop_codon:yes gene_type:complete